MSVLTLTTDFGTHDWFVGTMKGVIASIAPAANVIDLTHDLPPGEIRGGAFALAASHRFFPKGSIHVAVVDPGVGSRRKALAVQTAKSPFRGRDVFASVAAHLSRGVPIKKFGPALKDFVRLPWPRPRLRRGGVEGEVVYIDHFGNAI